MTFTEHLGELRNRIIYCIIALFVTCIGVFPFVKPYIFPWLMSPIKNIKSAQVQVLGPAEKFMAYFKVGVVAGLVLALPFILFQVWLFVKPGLKELERKWVRGLLWSSVFLFLAGCAFIFYLLLPIALRFLLTFDLGYDIHTAITLDKYFSFVLFLVLAGGLVFQIPLVTLFLAMVGLVSPRQMARFRKYAILITVILGSRLTLPQEPGYVVLDGYSHLSAI